MAENDGLLRDADGDTPDWIEVQNTSAIVVNLSGWFLTDDATNLTKWQFPPVSLNPGAYLVVFASGKNRTIPAAELHTNFQLDNAGEYLALVQPDGVSVAHEFAPAYPPQHANVSFGTGQRVTRTPLINSGAAAKLVVPSDDSLGSAWTAAGFNDSAWTSATTAVGFDTTPSQVVLRLDFNRRDAAQASTTMAGWSSFLINSNGGIVIQTAPTVRTYGSVTVTLSNTAPAGYDDRIRAGPVNSGAFTESLLLRDFVFSRSQTDNGGLDLTVDGLAPQRPYTITVWSFDANSPGNRVSDWYANGVLVRENYSFNGATPPTSNTQYRFTLQTASDALGRILISGRRDSSSVGSTGAADFGVFLNAVQIEQASYQPLVATDVRAAMQNQNASAYLRVPFTVSDPGAIQELTLRMKYDDGFAAYINGQPVASANAPATLAWNAAAPAAHSQVFSFQPFSFAAPSLVSGANVLAIHGLNASAADSDFFLLPELEGTSTLDFAGRFFATPTPGAANELGFVGVVADTRFSVDRGFFDAPFSAAITTATEGATIWYTFNGSKPSPTNGFPYSTPILITNTAFLRAAAYKDNHIPSDVDTHTYIFLDQVIRQPANPPGYPMTWVDENYPADYAMDPNVVNHPDYAASIKEDLRAIPTLSIVASHDDLWGPVNGIYPRAESSGELWERSASAELILPDGSTAFAVNCGLRMQGNASRDNVRTPKHSFRLLFQSEHGPTKLNYDWFPGPVEEFDNIVLRACFTDAWTTRSSPGDNGARYRPDDSIYLRDVWTKDSLRDLGWLSGRSDFVHLYVNGLYWGLYNPSERLDASYFAEHLGGREEDWDVIRDFSEVLAGTKTEWDRMMAIVNAGITNETAYQAVAALVDVENLIDYMLLHIFAEAEDWPHHNWYAAHRHATNGLPATKWIFLAWDQEIVLDQLVRRNRIDVNNNDTPARIYSQLRAWPEFRRLFADRIQKHLFNAGALTYSNNVARLAARVAQLERAIVGESARWGDAREFTIGPNPGTGKTFTRNEHWLPELDKLYTNFLATLNDINISRFRAGGLFPNLNAPIFSQFGGPISNTFALSITHSNVGGTIFFTTGGEDPRVYGTGQVAPTAQAYSEPITFNRPTIVRARVVHGSVWSALVEATFYPPQDFSGLALTEIMYNPPAAGLTNGENFEFIELKNTGTNALDLSGLVFSGINFTFPHGTIVLPGNFSVLVRNPEAFGVKYPTVTFLGVYSGRLDNGGELLRLATPDGAGVFAVTYDDEAPWPVASDSHGYSIVPRHGGLTQAPDNGSNWRASAAPGGSPGADDPAPSVPPVFINEVLSASVPPDVDRIELFNPNTAAVDVSGWFLTDSLDNPRKFRIPDGTLMQPGAYLAFSESHFNPTPGVEPSFALSSAGDQVYLFSADTNGNFTGFTHGFMFEAADPGVSFGRYVNSVGDEQFPAQRNRSFNSANSGPRVGSVVINEVNYHPALGSEEFLELHNSSATNVVLTGWRLDGLGFVFSEPESIPSQGYIVLVQVDPAAFRLKHAVPETVPVYVYAGALQDSGERIKLQHPGTPDTNGVVPFITMDEVRYNDRAPWPPAPDGSGASLARHDVTAYADDPINWMSAVPTPGRANLSDLDADGLPDEWESQHGTTDSDADPDGDGVNNLQEYRSGTNPNDAADFLQFTRIDLSAPSVRLEFTALANRSYSILAKPSFDAPAWSPLFQIPLASTNRTLRFIDQISSQTRFYRLVTPATP